MLRAVRQANLEAAEPATEAAERRLLIALGVAVFMVNLDARVVAPLLPTLAEELDVSLATSGWLVSAYALPYGLCQLMFGPLADRYGKIRVCVHAMAAFSLGTACTAIWPTFEAMVTLRALTGAAAAGLIPLTLAHIGDTVPYSRRQAAIGLLMAAGGAAQALSTGLGGSIAAFFSWHAVFPSLGALAFISTIGVYAAGRRARHAHVVAGRPRYAAVLATPGLRPLLALVAVEGALFMGGFSFLSGLLEERFASSAFDIGLVLSLAGLAQLVTARALPWFLRRLNQRAMLGYGGLALAAAYFASAFAPRVWVVAAACGLLGVGFILCHTTLQTRATEAFPGGRGTAVALFAFSLFLGAGVGTAALGALLELLGFTLTFALIASCLLAFTWVVVRVLGQTESGSANVLGARRE